MTSPDPQPSADRYSKVKAMLFKALELEPAAHPAFLDEACGGDLELRRETEALLAKVDRIDGFLEERVDLDIGPAATPSPEFLERKDFGEFGKLEVIGYGGMGVVYRAEQASPRRPVALKLLRHDCVDQLARKRFARETDALGRLKHPGIAQIYEAGVLEAEMGNQPYFAMEYVHGVTITQFAKRVQPSTKHLFSLIAEVGDALQHAHDQGVLHRDIKPGNILVERSGQPKLLDFGVAQVRDECENAFRTETGQLLGTIAYMSPEQARGESVDERSDQFSLAVILYELLTDRMPFAVEGDSLPDLVRNTAEGEPTPLRDLDPNLRGDAHTILHKALNSDPRRRYPSVSAFVQDLRNYVEGRAIHGQPPTAGYLLGRALKRHRTLVTSLALILVTVGAAWFLIQASTERARSAQELASREGERALRLSHARLHEELVREADDLWPIGPELVAPIDSWLARAAELRSALPVHRVFLDELSELPQAQTTPGSPVQRQRALVSNIESLLSEDPPGLEARLRVRRERCADVALQSIERFQDSWDWACARIADVESNPHYRGLRIEPQVGLVPLGQDPRSGLFEFALYGPTGVVPERDAASGRIAMDDASTLVLVLFPGGSFLMGAQREDSSAPNYDAEAEAHEGPPRLVELAPFFLSKYELTQGQWLRLGESPNPSYWEAGSQHADEIPFTPRNPVEHLSRNAALDFLRKIGCTLPSEAQWEYGARGISSWPALDPAGSTDLAEQMNLRGSDSEMDAYMAHAPVGSFAPNPAGLHDILGNVWELCLDDYKVRYHDLPLRPGDGLVLADGGGDFSLRGASANSSPEIARISMRSDTRTDHLRADIGVRPARALAGQWSLPDEAPRVIEASASRGEYR